jgi:hypothetical protein
MDMEGIKMNQMRLFAGAKKLLQELKAPEKKTLPIRKQKNRLSASPN